MQSLHHVVSALYGVPAGEQTWRQGLDAVAAEFDAWGVELMGVHNRTRAVTFSLVARMPAQAHLAYLQRYHRVDPRADVGRRLKAGEWVSCHEVFDEAFVREDRFFQDFLLPHGGRWFTGARLIDGPEVSVLFGVHRGLHQAPLDADEKLRLALAGEHVARAYRLDCTRQSTSLRAEVGATLLDRLPSCVLLVDTDGAVLHGNPPALASLAQGPAWADDAGHLRLPDPLAQRAWQRLLAALRGPMPSLEDAHTPHTIVLQQNGSPQILWVWTLWPQATRAAVGPSPRALLMWPDDRTRASSRHLVRDLAELFGLTPAQAGVAQHLLQGCTVQQVSRLQGVSLSTVRTHVRQLLLKTDTRRQVELLLRLGRALALPV